MLVRILSLVLFLGVATVSSSPSVAQRAGQSAADVAYRINPGDELEILVWGDERLQRTVRVLPDGTFAFPLVGQVVAAGRLPAELEKAISTGLQPQYRGPVPQVTVSVKNPSGYQFSVIGRVRSPGTFTPGRYVSALEALSIAGGPTEFAQIGDINIIRKSSGQLYTVEVRLTDILRGESGRLSWADNPLLQSGDTLVVP